jgi:hypothetical protein
MITVSILLMTGLYRVSTNVSISSIKTIPTVISCSPDQSHQSFLFPIFLGICQILKILNWLGVSELIHTQLFKIVN